MFEPTNYSIIVLTLFGKQFRFSGNCVWLGLDGVIARIYAHIEWKMSGLYLFSDFRDITTLNVLIFVSFLFEGA